MDKQIVAVSINKVQTFLFDTILSHTQEKQAEAATLNKIMSASNEISEEFNKKINAAFDDTEITELLSCSGVYIFECELDEKSIDEKLNQLFVSYYRDSQGKKQLRYVYFPKENQSELEAIKKAKQLLAKPDNFTVLVEKNKEVLFNFEDVSEDDRKTKEESDYTIKYPKFAKDINALFDLDDRDKSNHFRMAVIKADLDGMGDLFKGIDDYQDYRAISDILNDHVSPEGLHRAAADYLPNHKDGWIHLFYIAGDDIFFAVSIANLINGIDVCRKMLVDINGEIEKVSPDYKLSMSIGVEITFNREPVRYYLSMVEDQLKCAKKIKLKDVLKSYVQTKIAFSGVVWLDINMSRLKADKKRLNKDIKNNSQKISAINQAIGDVPVWNFFLDEVRILNYIKSEDDLKEYIGKPHFFYSLLEKLTNKEIYQNNTKYINNLLYHLIPQYMDTSIDKDLWQAELLINRGIIYQLYQKKLKGKVIELSDDRKARLEAYLRLMLLFSDERFSIEGVEGDKGFKFSSDEQTNVRKELLSKPMEYLYHSLKKDHNSQLLKYFAVYVVMDKKRKHLELLNIEKTMFYRLRKVDKIDIKKAAKMIALKNCTSRKELTEKNKTREEFGKKPKHLFFDKDSFRKEAEEGGQWTEDFIDSLMLLYEYNSLLRRYKGRCKELEGGSKK